MCRSKLRLLAEELDDQLLCIYYEPYGKSNSLASFQETYYSVASKIIMKTNRNIAYQLDRNFHKDLVSAMQTVL